MLEIVFLLFIVGLLSYLWSCRRPNNYPPGPNPLPFFGNIFQLPKSPRHLYQAVEEWAMTYGPIIGLTLRGSKLVLVTGADNVLAALRKEEFQSRPDSFAVRARSFGKCLGIFFGHGDQWSSTRKFVIKQIRAYGKNEKENVIVDEITQLMDNFKDNTVMQGTGIFGLSAVNVIWTIIANKRINFNDKKSKQFLKDLNEMMRRGNPGGGNLVDISPIFRFIDSNYKFQMNVIKKTQDYIRQTIREHQEILDPNNPMDLIDHYLIEMKQNNSGFFTEEDLIMVGMDLFIAGAESTSNSIEYILLYMILYPEIQEKMQEELDRVLGRARKPNLNDKASLPYTMAVLTEIERINSVAPTNVPRSCVRDTTFGGFFIPKGATISINLRSLGYDPKYWKNPKELNPRRHLSDEGKFVKSAVLATFGGGSRVCVGEVMARNIIFLFTTTFLEKFSVSLPEGEPKPSTVSLPGFTTAPRPFKFKIKSRY